MLWAVMVRERVVGSLVCETGCWRLAWFDGADERLASYPGPIDGDPACLPDALAAALSRRLGATVRLDSLEV